jgi:hypothetical protein
VEGQEGGGNRRLKEARERTKGEGRWRTESSGRRWDGKNFRRGRRSEGGGQRSVDGGRRSEAERRRSEVKELKAERTEAWGRYRAEDGDQDSEGKRINPICSK